MTFTENQLFLKEALKDWSLPALHRLRATLVAGTNERDMPYERFIGFLQDTNHATFVAYMRELRDRFHDDLLLMIQVRISEFHDDAARDVFASKTDNPYECGPVNFKGDHVNFRKFEHHSVTATVRGARYYLVWNTTPGRVSSVTVAKRDLRNDTIEFYYDVSLKDRETVIWRLSDDRLAGKRF